jgi:TIR domain-containing protein
MAFKYSCFISYCHGQYDLTKGFIDQLKIALKAELDAYLDEEVYIDEERLKPGYQYNEELAQAICQSVCMVVVYSPRYERHEYCVREFEGMEALEALRVKALGDKSADGRRCIIPIVLRGEDDLPARIKAQKHYADFSKFSLTGTDILHNEFYVGEIRKIATVIYQQYKLFQVITEPCGSCTEFRLPDRSGVVAWRPQFLGR